MGLACCKPQRMDFDGPVELSHFSLQRSVGKGSFGKVRIVQHKKTKEVFALKYINKLKCIRMKAVNNIIQERRILEEASSTFICNLRYAFQDDENLFMVLDLMLGGDLRFHLDRLGTLPEASVKFIIAELCLALTYLHNRNIVHRDIKPDNILLDAKGHAHLTDFNIAVMCRKDQPLKSVAGSMAYMAPEILAKKGYYVNVDYWSLGVVLYEAVYGKRPFKSKTNDGLIAAIKKGDVVYGKESQLSITGVEFLKGLLTKNPEERLGSSSQGGHDQLRKHSWFSVINWELLSQKKSIPLFQPDPTKANFDATHELEELFLEDHPLKVKKRKRIDNENGTIKPKFGEDPQVTEQLQLMEKKFAIYDYTKSPNAEPRYDAKISLSAIKTDINIHQNLQSTTSVDIMTSNIQEKTSERPYEEESLHRDVMEGRSVLDLINETESSAEDKDSNN